MRTLIENARIIDGTGRPAYRGSVIIEDEHLAEVGDTSLAPDHVIDARGSVVAPGFIDMHSHSDFTLPGMPTADAKVMQGVTTEVVGNCGLGILPSNARVEKFYEFVSPILFGEPTLGCFESLDLYRSALEGRGVSVNVACLVPHSNVRNAVMGLEERIASDLEIEQMSQLVDEMMSQGGFGFSTGLVYPPGAFANTEEIVALARTAAKHGGFYATHMRDEGTRLMQSVEEALTIGREANIPVQISHHKAAGRTNWGKTKKTLERLAEARTEGIDVHSDVYPYTAGSTLLSAMFLPLWAFEGSQRALMERLADPRTRKKIIEDSIQRWLSFLDLPPGMGWFPKKALLPVLMFEISRIIVISSTRYQHHYEGMSLREVAKLRGQGLYEAILDLLLEEETAVAAIAHAMHEDDVTRVMLDPYTMIGTDGFPQTEGKPHPRTYGTYPRVLEHYVRERGVLSLETAVHKMTGLVAQKAGLADRGTLAVGKRADVVLFDPAGVRDHATYEDPARAPDGFSHLFVNGTHTVKDGRHTGGRGGRVLARS